jgi:tRNA (cmo5U34)-methyltransferase
MKFDFNTIENFDNHISTSILGYDLLHEIIVNLLSFFVNEKSYIVDLGCTSGKLIKKIKIEYNCNVVGYDITDKHFNSLDFLVKADITDDSFQFKKSDVMLSIFFMQFIEYNDRLKVLKKIYNALPVKGIFIMTEKEIIKNSYMQEIFNFTNYDYKKNNFTNDEIMTKEKQLRTVMTLNTQQDNMNLLKQSGFKTIETFFQSLQFRGYICQK